MKTKGAINKSTHEYRERYETLLIKHGDPLEVLFKLMKCRKKSIQVQAASALISYRYPKIAVAQIETETATQLTMLWETSNDMPPVQPIELERVEKVIN